MKFLIPILSLTAAFIIGGLISYFFSRYFFLKKLTESKYIDAMAKDQLRHDLQVLHEKNIVLEHEKKNHEETKEQHMQLQKSFQVALERITALETERTILNEQRAAQIKQMQEMQEHMKLQFENLGNKIFSEHSTTFKLESQNRLNELLSPLKGDIDGFKRKLEESFGQQAKEQHSLKSEIERIVKINEQMTSQTNDLTKALKGDFKVQGNWGEIILERILEESGLRLGEDYILQGADLAIKHPESGQHLKPDVIINLPENKHIIVDSKVSLTDYEKFCSAENEEHRIHYLKQFLSSVKNHVNDLEKRRYQDADQMNTPDFVLMFMPIEGAFSLAIQQDAELHSYAWGKKVVMVCPSTLFATLRTIASIWRFELQHRNAIEIAKQGGLLYDKVEGFVSDMKNLGKQLQNSQDTYTTAMNKLCDGKGNILRKTEQLKALGAKASKNLLKAIPEAFDHQEEPLQQSDGSLVE